MGPHVTSCLSVGMVAWQIVASGLSVVLLVALCLVALFGPIHIQRMRIENIVDQVLELPHLEIIRRDVYLTGWDGPPGFYLRFTTETDAREAIEFYRDTLTAQGWEMLDVSFRDVKMRSIKFSASAVFEIPGKYNLSITASDARWKAYDPNSVSSSLRAWNWSNKPKVPEIETEEEKILREALERQKEGQKEAVIDRTND